MFTHKLNLRSYLGTSWHIFPGFLIHRPNCRLILLSLSGGAGLAWQGGPFPFHRHCRPRKWFIGNLRISFLPSRDQLCCCRLHSCLVRDEYWYLHTHGVTASHTHYWPRHYNYCLSFQLSIPVPTGTTSFGCNSNIFCE